MNKLKTRLAIIAAALLLPALASAATDMYLKIETIKGEARVVRCDAGACVFDAVATGTYSVQVCDEQANPEGPMFEGMTTDISEEGFKIELPRGAFDLLAEESQHGLRHMRVILNLQPDHVQGICKVCHVKRKEHVTKTAHCSVGLQVTGMNGIARQQLKNMCVRIGLDKMRDRLWRG